jgi:hypothetical protein
VWCEDQLEIGDGLDAVGWRRKRIGFGLNRRSVVGIVSGLKTDGPALNLQHDLFALFWRCHWRLNCQSAVALSRGEAQAEKVGQFFEAACGAFSVVDTKPITLQVAVVEDYAVCVGESLWIQNGNRCLGGELNHPVALNVCERAPVKAHGQKTDVGIGAEIAIDAEDERTVFGNGRDFLKTREVAAQTIREIFEDEEELSCSRIRGGHLEMSLL